MTPMQQFLLGLLQEESAEVIQAVSKVNRFGLHDSHEKTGNVPNVDLLRNEYKDLLSVVRLLEENGLALPTLDEEYYKYKKEKILRYLDYSKSLGRFNELSEISGNGRSEREGNTERTLRERLFPWMRRVL